MEGALQMFHQKGHTLRTLVRISTVPSLWRMFEVMSLGSSSQLGFVVVISSFAFFFIGFEEEEEDIVCL
jgi:hypothetical protein